MASNANENNSSESNGKHCDSISTLSAPSPESPEGCLVWLGFWCSWSCSRLHIHSLARTYGVCYGAWLCYVCCCRCCSASFPSLPLSLSLSFSPSSLSSSPSPCSSRLSPSPSPVPSVPSPAQSCPVHPFPVRSPSFPVHCRQSRSFPGPFGLLLGPLSTFLSSPVRLSPVCLLCLCLSRRCRPLGFAYMWNLTNTQATKLYPWEPWGALGEGALGSPLGELNLFVYH